MHKELFNKAWGHMNMRIRTYAQKHKDIYIVKHEDICTQAWGHMQWTMTHDTWQMVTNHLEQRLKELFLVGTQLFSPLSSSQQPRLPFVDPIEEDPSAQKCHATSLESFWGNGCRTFYIHVSFEGNLRTGSCKNICSLQISGGTWWTHAFKCKDTCIKT